MSPLTIACIIFACTVVGTLLGMMIARALPGHHLSGESKDAVKQSLGFIATLTALVIGLLVAATKGTYDSQSAAVKELAANVALLDRVLNRYGPETKEPRELLRSLVSLTVEKMWPDSGQPADVASSESRVVGEAMFDKIAALDAKTDAQRLLKSRALEISIGLGQIRQRLLAQKESSIPAPFLIVLTFWLTILFLCYGMLSPRNLTVGVSLVVCMLSVAAALFLVLELDRPFDGVMRVSSAPLRAALSRLGE
jgi:hypothetical protein